jgi:multiple sugar transport system permease protein
MAQHQTVIPIPRQTTRRMSKVTRRNLTYGLMFISPWIIGFLVFTLYPMVASFYYSFTDYDVLTPVKFVGLANFTDMFKNELFLTSLYNTLYFAIFSIPTAIVLSVMIALLLNTNVRGMSFYRTVFFLPSIVPAVAGALLWAWILNPQFGLANAILKSLHLPRLGWLSDPTWSKPSLILMGLWGVGGSMVIYLAALQDVPKELYEASELDGANAWQKTWTITIPLITPTIFFDLVLGIIGTFQYFTTVFVITQGAGGPMDSTLMYGLLLYRNAFTYLKMGYASAMAWFLFAIVLIITMVVFRSSGRWVFYQGDVKR